MNLEKNQSIALLVGAGAVVNAWNPIIRALQPEYFPELLSIDGATSGLARLVYMMRWFSNNPGDGLEKTSQILKLTKSRISEELKKSQENNEIFVRPELGKIIDCICESDCTRFLFITTNWDTVTEDYIDATKKLNHFGNRIIAAHIHGSCLDPINLYLPSEIVEEPYRSNDERIQLGKMHASVMQALFEANILVIYGLSISPLDAELSQILGAAINNPNMKSIKIIDPNHKRVAERLNLLVAYPNTKISIEGYDPIDFSLSQDHSLK